MGERNRESLGDAPTIELSNENGVAHMEVDAFRRLCEFHDLPYHWVAVAAAHASRESVFRRGSYVLVDLAIIAEHLPIQPLPPGRPESILADLVDRAMVDACHLLALPHFHSTLRYPATRDALRLDDQTAVLLTCRMIEHVCNGPIDDLVSALRHRGTDTREALIAITITGLIIHIYLDYAVRADEARSANDSMELLIVEAIPILVQNETGDAGGNAYAEHIMALWNHILIADEGVLGEALGLLQRLDLINNRASADVLRQASLRIQVLISGVVARLTDHWHQIPFMPIDDL